MAQTEMFEVFGLQQGFFKYNEQNELCSDPFHVYPQQEILQTIDQLTPNHKTTAYPNTINTQCFKQEELIPVVTDVSPLIVRAGMGDTITITGTGFGANYVGQAAVKFRNPDYYGITVAYSSAPDNHIVQWSDTQIKIIVPGRDILLGSAGAGSGAVRVFDNDGLMGESTQSITVLFNKYVAGFKAANLSNDNSNGGYRFRKNNNFASNNNANDALQRALDTWKCQALTNFAIGTNNTTISCAAADNTNLITFDNNCQLPAGLLAQTSQWFQNCSSGDKYFDEIDMVFDAETNWNFGPQATSSNKKDFESIVLHELGHAQGLGHVLDYGKLMYPSLATGVDIRTIDNDALRCAAVIWAHSMQNNNCAGGQAIPIATCGTNIKLKLFLEGAYNSNNAMNTNISNILPNTQPYQTAPWNYNGSENSNSIPSNIVDWVLVEARTSPSAVPTETKAALLRNDGMIMGANAQEGLIFNNLLPYSTYYFVVRHRNHLAVMSKTPDFAPNGSPLDLTKLSNIRGGISQVVALSDGNHALCAGDFIANGIISVDDFNYFYDQNGTPPNTYNIGDCNLDRNVTVSDYNQYEPNSTRIGIQEIRY